MLSFSLLGLSTWTNAHFMYTMLLLGIVYVITFGVLWGALLISNSKQPSQPKGRGWRFCPLCGSTLHMGDADGKQRLKCDDEKCPFVHWANPKPVSVILIPSADGGLVLIKRNVEPRIGMFALPGGFVDTGESEEEAAIREAFEETGLKIEIDRLLTKIPLREANQILNFYLAKPTTETPKKGSDAAEAAVFNRDSLPQEIAFPSHAEVIEQWFVETGAKS